MNSFGFSFPVSCVEYGTRQKECNKRVAAVLDNMVAFAPLSATKSADFDGHAALLRLVKRRNTGAFCCSIPINITVIKLLQIININDLLCRN